MAILKTPPTSLDNNLLVAPYVDRSGVLGMPPIETAQSPTSEDILPLSYAIGVNSTEGAALLPRLTSDQRDALTVTAGMRIFNVTTSAIETYDGTLWLAGGSNGFFSLASRVFYPSEIVLFDTNFYELVPEPAPGYIIFPVKATAVFQKNNSDFTTVADIHVMWRNVDANLQGDATQSPFNAAILALYPEAIEFQYGLKNDTIGLSNGALFNNRIVVHSNGPIVNSGDGSGRLRIDLVYKTQLM